MEATVKGFKKCCISNAVDGTDMLYVSEDGNFRRKCEEDEGSDCEDGDSDIDGKCRWNLTCFVNQMVKIFFLSRHFIFGGCCRLVVFLSGTYGI